jgi:uncharacterized protein (TIGR00730 family)
VKLQSVCVFCAANPGSDPVYREQAFAMGKFLAEGKRRVVFGGGRTGLMGALAEGALSAGGEIIGVMPKHLVDREVAHTGLTELRIVHSMHERKALLSELADGFIAMPGGLGTMEELLEVWTWAQLGLHRKPYGLFNVKGYFDQFLAFIDRGVDDRFIDGQYRNAMVAETDPGRLVERMESLEPPAVRKWLKPGET